MSSAATSGGPSVRPPSLPESSLQTPETAPVAVPTTPLAKTGNLSARKTELKPSGGVSSFFKGLFGSSTSNSKASVADSPINTTLSPPHFSASASIATRPQSQRIGEVAASATIIHSRQRVASPPPDSRTLEAPTVAPRIGFYFESKKLSSSHIAKATPEELLEWNVLGADINAEKFLTAANTLAAKMQREPSGDVAKSATLHLLYEKAAKKFMIEGKPVLAFEARAMSLQKASLSENHQLHNLSRAITEGVLKQKNPSFGAHFSGLGCGMLKGGHLRIDRRNIEGVSTDCFQMRLGEHARRDLQHSLGFITSNWDAFQASLPPELQGGVTITRVPHVFKGKTGDEAYTNKTPAAYHPGNAQAIQIEFHGVGKIIIGDTKQIGCLYNDVTVEIPSNLPTGQGLKVAHQMLTLIGGGAMLQPQRPEDDQRMKLAQLFRSYFPSEANGLERNNEFYEISLDALKTAMNTKTRGKMGEILKEIDKNPGLMQKVEIYPGQQVWSVNSISKEMRAKGAIGLMAGVGSRGSLEECVQTIAEILTVGTISSKDRFQTGKFHVGASSEDDLASGGGDRVFTRLVNHKTTNHPITDFIFSGHVQVLYDLDVINRGAYAYDRDLYGLKNPEVNNLSGQVDPMESYDLNYATRSNMIDFAGESSNTWNEVMIKNRVGPEFIRGLVVKDQNAKEKLVKGLSSLIVVKNDVDYIKVGDREILVNEFIKISGPKNLLNPNMWNL